MSTTVIIGFAEALPAPEVAWSLVDNGFNLIAFTRKGRRAALKQSRFVRVFEVTAPETDLAQARADLMSALARLKRAVEVPVALMPLDDQALWLCGKMDFDSKVLLVGPREAALDLAINKQKQVELAQASGFSVPSSRCVERIADIPKAEIHFPVVFKPALAVSDDQKRLSRGRAWVCADADELKSAVNHWAGRGPMLLQHFVLGVGEGIFGLATAHGVLAWSGHRRVRMMNPQGSGASACTAVQHLDEETKIAAARFLQNSGWRGLFMIELLRDDFGKLWFIEFNGRAWGSMALARRLGLEYPAWAVKLALNPDAALTIPAANGSLPLCRHLAREILHLFFVIRGSQSRALARWPSVWKTLSQVCRIGREDCWYNWRRNDPMVFVSDCFTTLWTQLIGTKTQ